MRSTLQDMVGNLATEPLVPNKNALAPYYGAREAIGMITCQ